MSESLIEDSKHLTRTSDVLGGKVRITGRRLSAHHIGKRHERGKSICELSETHDVTTDSVRAAVGYYRNHPREMAAIDRHRERLLTEADADSDIPTTPEALANL